MKTHRIYLSEFQPILGSPLIPQTTANRYLSRLMTTAQCVQSPPETPAAAQDIYTKIKTAIAKYGVAESAISQRQLSILPDNLNTRLENPKDIANADLFENILDNPSGAKLQDRMTYFNTFVSDIVAKMYENDTTAPDDIIHATCSGYLSPSPVQTYASKRQWQNTTITHSYHMGCYGAFPPVRMAAGFLSLAALCETPKKKVDIVHTELLSIHLDITNYDPGNIINMTLFADGFIKYSAKYAAISEIPENSLSILGMADFLIPDSLEDMSWVPGEHQFDMYLSKNVPTKIRDNLTGFIETICQKTNIDFEDEKENMIFAIHPGGPKILDHIQDSLYLAPHQINHARDVLKTNGNMSSATIPHIWKAIAEDPTIPKHCKIFTMAFGPGLTATGFILEKH
jgi:predicted naringenin-chalcone synthase